LNQESVEDSDINFDYDKRKRIISTNDKNIVYIEIKVHHSFTINISNKLSSESGSDDRRAKPVCPDGVLGFGRP
jgi:hypothetical protein